MVYSSTAAALSISDNQLLFSQSIILSLVTVALENLRNESLFESIFSALWGGGEIRIIMYN